MTTSKSRTLLAGVALAAFGLAAPILFAPSAALAQMTTPSMSWPLAANPEPTTIDAGPLGNVYVTGAISAIGYGQNNPGVGDVDSRLDMSNTQVFVQTTEGPIQFFAQFGAYSIPVIGVPYFEATDNTKGTFGTMPQAFVKFVPNDSFSVMVGKLPTLIGAEYTFTFQNANIQRGLVWNQENAVNRGVQVNYAAGPLTLSASINDGFYSDEYSWGSMLAAYTIDDSNVLAFAAGANFEEETTAVGFATPPLQNNQEIYNLIWTHTSGPLTVMPYFQYTKVPKLPAFGITEESSTTGYAVLGKYSVSDSFSWAARAEYISTDSGGGGANLLYGPNSAAWSLTVTPTFQKGSFFVRGELSYLKINDFVAGSGLGDAGLDKSQTRALIETGILF